MDLNIYLKSPFYEDYEYLNFEGVGFVFKKHQKFGCKNLVVINQISVLYNNFRIDLD